MELLVLTKNAPWSKPWRYLLSLRRYPPIPTFSLDKFEFFLSPETDSAYLQPSGATRPGLTQQ